MKRINILAVIASFYLVGCVKAEIAKEEWNIDATLVVTTCTGANANCPVTIQKGKINAIGEAVYIDLGKEPVTSLIPKGQKVIENEQTALLDLPAKGKVKIYSFVPSEGELAGQLIYVALDDVETGRGRLAGKTFIRILRQLKGDKPDQWLEAGMLVGPNRPSKWLFTLKPDGTLVTFAGKDKTEIEFGTGKKILGS